MKYAMRLLQLSIAAAFSILLLIVATAPETTQRWVLARPRPKERVDLAPDQFFSAAKGSTIEYTIYIENLGSSPANYTLTASSNQGYFVEVWRDTDQLGGGDIQLIPPQGSGITLGAGEVATLIVRVTVPSDATDGTVDTTTIEAVSTYSGASDSVTVRTSVNSDLPYRSDWIQLGSDPKFPAPPPRVDVKALYYTNNGTHVFFRMAQAGTPDPTSFRYVVFMDTRAGGQQIGSYFYDYYLSSDGILYEWNDTDWVDSGYSTYWRVDGTNIVLWADLNNLSMDMQDIHFLARIATKDMTMKDELEPYTILRDNIPEMPLALIPLVTLAIYLAVFSRRKRLH